MDKIKKTIKGAMELKDLLRGAGGEIEEEKKDIIVFSRNGSVRENKVTIGSMEVDVTEYGFKVVGVICIGCVRLTPIGQ